MSTTEPVPSSTTITNWDHVKETVRMLNLAVARLEHAMTDSTNQVNTLTHSFTTLADSIDSMSYAAGEMSDDMPHKHAILYHAKDVTKNINSAVMAFQFYDKLCQRLAHISKSLQGLNEILDDPAHINNPDAWHNLQGMIRSKYTLDSDKAMFEALMSGKSVAEILNAALDDPSNDDVELF